MLQTVFPLRGESLSLGETVLVRFLLAVLYVAMIVLAVRIATALDHRHYSGFGLTIDTAWLLDFGVGTVLSAAGILLSLGWGVVRGFRTVDLTVSASGPGGPLFLGVALATFLLYFLLGNVYEEVVYRGVVLQNATEGLRARGLSERWAVVLATVASLVLFGLYHLPLRGTVLVTVDSAMIGSTFALAYLLTGELGLPLGIHFGRASIELLTGIKILGVTVPSVLHISQNSLAANLELRLLEIGVICSFILTWVYLTKGGIRVAEGICEQTDHSH